MSWVQVLSLRPKEDCAMAEAGQWSYTDDAVRLGSWKRFADIRVKSDQLNTMETSYETETQAITVLESSNGPGWYDR